MRFVCMLGACLAAGASAAPADTLDLYLGTGLGYATVQESFVPVGVVEHPLGWKLFGGWRPIQMLGAELEYVDLGSRDSTSFGSYVNSEQAQADAIAAFAVGYLPQPLPYLDFYGKLGVARVRSSFSSAYSASCSGEGACPLFIGLNRMSGTATRFAYGAGVQGKLGMELVRLEYQGFSGAGGDQSLLSLDVAFSF
jgi:opacity protein-like surface antigen